MCTPLLKSRSGAAPKSDLLLRAIYFKGGAQQSMFGLKMVRFGSPDLRTGALGVKRGRGTVSPYSRGRAGPKKAHFGQNSKFDPRSIFWGDLFLGRSIFRERCVSTLSRTVRVIVSEAKV